MATQSNITRRRALSTLAGASVATAALAVPVAAAETDPLSTAIAAYLDGLAAFNATPYSIIEADEDGVIAATYGPPMDVLMEWDRPAQSLSGAVDALRLAAKESREGGWDIPHRMVEAALAFFDGPAA